MTSLTVKFKVPLQSTTIRGINWHGPLFHRWMPNGESDAIGLATDQPGTALRVWFERFGHISASFHYFNEDEHDCDAAQVSRLAVLDAGPLMGSLSLDSVPDDAIEAVTSERTGAGPYLRLGKQIIKLIHPPVSRFIDVLRTHFGQYWIEPLEHWDSRARSLGSYCAMIRLEWVGVDGSRRPFIPNMPSLDVGEVVLNLGPSAWGQDYHDSLTRADWQKIAELSRQQFGPSLAGFLLSRAHGLLDQGDVRGGLIEAVTALEVAMSEFLRGQLGGTPDLLGRLPSERQSQLATQFILLAPPRI